MLPLLRADILLYDLWSAPMLVLLLVRILVYEVPCESNMSIILAVY